MGHLSECHRIRGLRFAGHTFRVTKFLEVYPHRYVGMLGCDLG
jgi:hypothetical protein